MANPDDHATVVMLQRRLSTAQQRLDTARDAITSAHARIDDLVAQLQALGIAVTRPTRPQAQGGG